MSTNNRTSQDGQLTPSLTSRDQDVHKGAIEDGHPSPTTNAPGLDADGLPDDETVIAASALAARVDGSQG